MKPPLSIRYAAAVAASLALTTGLTGAPTVLNNRTVRVTLDPAANGAITSVVDKASGMEFVATQSAPRLFSLSFSTKEGGDRRLYLSSRDAKSFSMQSANGTTTLNYSGLREYPVRVTCTATVSDRDPLVRWRISVTIPDGLVLEEVQFPLLVLRAPLGASAPEDAAVIGLTKGGVIRAPAAMKTGARVSGKQPGNLAAQFATYYSARAGFYLAAYDEKGSPKTLEMRRTAEGVEMDWDLHSFAPASYSMDFDVVMTTFTGAGKNTPSDWRDAADIYKTWALRQRWCATPYEKRRDIPAWMKAGPAMVRFNRQWLAEPSRIEAWFAEYWKKRFPDAPLITAYWGWEKIGNWVTPDYFPLFPSDEQFTRLAGGLRASGSHAFPWPSGYHWTLMFQKNADGSFQWDDRKRFDEVARAHAVHTRDGKLYVRTPSWLGGGDTACLCPGDPWTIRWWNEEVSAPLARRGAEMIQVDQVVGGNFPFCYDRRHGHPPGPGPWMTEVFATQLQTMYATLKKIQPDAVVCFEEPNERFNHLVGIQDYRDCESPYEWASVFNYLYHEFLPTFQSNPRAGDQVMAAYCLVNGQIPHMTPSSRDLADPVLTNGAFERSGKGDWFAGWDHVRGYQGRVWSGRAARDEAEKHGGASSLRLENSADTDIVQVSQNVPVTEPGNGFAAGGTYRLSAWMKTGALARPGAASFAFFGPGMKSLGAGGKLVLPAARSDWSRVTARLTVPEGAEIMRIMIHLEGKAQAWVDDMTLEEELPDGTARQARYAGISGETRFMRRWVELYHGEGRPWLQFGRMLHPPKLTCATTTYRDRPVPVVLHNAFRAADGREAVVLANATRAPQPATLRWKGKDLSLRLQLGEVLLLK
jgi:hypothetical protein